MKIWTFYPGAQSNTVCVDMLTVYKFYGFHGHYKLQ